MAVGGGLRDVATSEYLLNTNWVYGINGNFFDRLAAQYLQVINV